MPKSARDDDQGSLYPALYHLERQGLVASTWKVMEHNRRARYYSLTAAGRRSVAAEQNNGSVSQKRSISCWG